MPARRDVEWDALHLQRPDALVQSKRQLEALDAQRVGWEPDWKLRVVMLREAREQAQSDAARERELRKMAADPDYRGKKSRYMKAAWQRGAFADRVVGCSKRTDERVALARRLREQDLTYVQIGEALGVSAYTAAKWLGWKRSERPKNRCPVVLHGVQYESQRACARETGLNRWYIQRNAVRVKRGQ